MRLLIDTNVLVAALVARGTCSDLLEHCVRQHVVVSSQSLLSELREVLERKFRQRAIDVRSAIRLFAETFTLTPDPLDPPACRKRDYHRRSGSLDLESLSGRPSAFWKWESERGSSPRK